MGCTLSLIPGTHCSMGTMQPVGWELSKECLHYIPWSTSYDLCANRFQTKQSNCTMSTSAIGGQGKCSTNKFKDFVLPLIQWKLTFHSTFVLKVIPASWEYAIKEEQPYLYQKIFSEKPRNIINLEKEPFCSRSSIRLHLIPIGTLVWPQSLLELKVAIRGILHGLEWLHGNFVHRDLRRNNVILLAACGSLILSILEWRAMCIVDFVLPIWPLLRIVATRRKLTSILSGRW
jgi:hypothetical protein